MNSFLSHPAGFKSKAEEEPFPDLEVGEVNPRAFGLKGLGGLQPSPGKIIQLVGMKIEPLSAQE